MVTPFMGVWIEISRDVEGFGFLPVTPFMGVWIEIFYKRLAGIGKNCHSLYGSVD